MPDAIGRLSGLSALMLAVLGVASPAGAFGGSIALTASTAVVTVGSAALIPGSSAGGFGSEPIRVVLSVGSGTLLLSASSTDVTVPFGYPPLGAEAAEVAMEGPEAAVNTALSELRWRPLQQGLTNLMIEAGPAGATYVPAGRTVTVLTAIAAPDAPTAFTVAPGAGNATVSWRPPASDGGSAIIGYVVAGSPAGWCSVTAATRSCVVGDLTAGTSYRFQVAAINDADLGAWSAPSAAMTPAELTPAGLTPLDPIAPDPTAPDPTAPDPTAPDLTPAAAMPLGPLTATAVAQRTTHPLPDAPATVAPPVGAPVTPVTTVAPVTSVAPVTTAAPVTAEAPVATDAPVSTPAASEDPTSVVAAATDTPAAGAAPQASSSVHVVFGVGVGVEVTAARFTVRGANLQAGSSVTITTNSDAAVLGTAVADLSGSVQWDGVLPDGLADGEHTLVADATAADGSALERIVPFEVAGGVLVRIGESSVVTADTVVTTVPVTTATVAAGAPGEAAGGGSSLPKILLIVLLLGGAAIGVLLWRSKPARESAQATWTRLRQKMKQPVGRH